MPQLPLGYSVLKTVYASAMAKVEERIGIIEMS